MKKLIVILLALATMLMLCVACGDTNVDDGTEGGSKPSYHTPSTSTTNRPQDPARKITLEEVMNHPESPSSDFQCIEDADGNLVLMKYLGNDDIVAIPEQINGKKIVTINQYSFGNNASVLGIRIPDTVRVIGDFSCGLATNLQCVVFGAGVEEVGASAFQGCKALAEVIMNDGVKVIKGNAFASCKSLRSIILPESIETIETAAFYSMSSDFKIIGKSGSVAETYAKTRGFVFEAN